MNRQLFDIVSDLENELCFLEEAAGTYDLVLGSLEVEGFQDAEAFDGKKAEAFARRFPAYLPALQMVHRDLTQRAGRLNELVTELYQTRKAG